LGGRYGKIFVLFFVLRESGGTKGGNVLKKCALSNYLCGGGGKGGASFIFSFFVIFTTCKFLFIFVYFCKGKGAWVYFSFFVAHFYF
jgi:hypothetical protein